MNAFEALMSFERTPCSKMEDPVHRVLARGVPERNAEICESPMHLVNCLSRTRGVLAFKVWKTLARRQNHHSSASISKSLDASTCTTPTIREECLSSFDSVTSLLILNRVMSRTDVLPLTSGRRSSANSSPLSPSDELEDDLVKNALRPLITNRKNCLPTSTASLVNTPVSGARMVRRWLKDRREKKKEEARVNNAYLHAAVSVASTAAAVAAITASTAASSSSMWRNNEEMMKMGMAVASAATLVAVQCVEAAEAMGANREHLASVISSAVNVRMHDDITTLTAAAATALRGAATMKARATKESLLGIPIPEVVEKLLPRMVFWVSALRTSLLMAPNFSSELGKEDRLRVHQHSRTSDIEGEEQKSRHVAGTLMKTDEIVVDVNSNIEQCRHFGLKTGNSGSLRI